MGYSLNNVTAPVAYSNAATLLMNPVSSVTVLVTNASIALQYALSDGRMQGPWETEQFLIPANYVYRSEQDFRGLLCVGIRFRTWLATSNPLPQVTVLA